MNEELIKLILEIIETDVPDSKKNNYIGKLRSIQNEYFEREMAGIKKHCEYLLESFKAESNRIKSELYAKITIS